MPSSPARATAGKKTAARLSAAWQAFYAGDTKTAGALVGPLMTSPDEAVWTEAKHLAARILWHNGTDQSRRRAKTIWTGLEKTTTRNVSKQRQKIAAALRLYAAGQRTRATDVLQPILVAEYKRPVTVEAAILLAKLYMRGGWIKDARRAKAFAVSFARRLEDEPELDTGRCAPFLAAARKLNIYDPAEKAFGAAEKHRRNGNYRKALAAYNNIVAAYPGSPFAVRSRLHIGHCYRGLGRAAAAVKHWTGFIEEEPAGPWRGQAHAAIIDTELAALRAPGAADTWAATAREALAEARSGTAAESWAAAERRLKLLFGLLHLSAGRGPAAAAALRESLAASRNPPATTRIAMRRLIHAAETGASVLPPGVRRGDGTASPDGAPAAATRLLSIGTCFCLLGRDADTEAIVSGLPAATMTPPRRSYASFLLALAVRRRGRKGCWQRALNLLARSIARYPAGRWHDETLYHMACCHLLEARKKYWQQPPERPWEVPVAERRKKDFSDLTDEERARRRRREQYDLTRGESLAAWRRLIDRFPESPRAAEAYYNIGNILWSLGKPARSAAALAKVVDAPASDWLAGEVYLTLGVHALEHNVRRQEAHENFLRLEAWLDRARKGDIQTGIAIDPDAGTFPPAWVMNAAAPPVTAEDRRRLDFSSEELRRCFSKQWYHDGRGAISARFEGFLLFTAGRFGKAIAQYDRMAALDPEITKESPNDYTRLKAGAEQGYLKALPRELKLYPDDRLRLAVFLADFYYCTREFYRSEAVCRRLLGGDFGALSAEQKDYPRYLIGTCIYWTRGRKLAFQQYCTVFGNTLANLRGPDVSYTRDAAALCAGNVALQSHEEAFKERGRRILSVLAGSGRDNRHVMWALHNHAQDLVRRGYHEKGFAILDNFPDKLGFKEVANHTAKTLREIIADGRFPKKEDRP